MPRLAFLLLLLIAFAGHGGYFSLAQSGAKQQNIFGQPPLSMEPVSPVFNMGSFRTEGEDSSMTVFPNPASDQLVVTVSDNVICQEIAVYNCIGVSVLKMDNINAHRVTIYLAHVPDGQYVLRAKTDKGFLYRKFIVNR
jgi:hypothetical protein